MAPPSFVEQPIGPMVSNPVPLSNTVEPGLVSTKSRATLGSIVAYSLNSFGRRLGLGLALGAGVLAYGGVRPDAEACTCIPTLEVDWPADGEVIPRNARILLSAHGCWSGSPGDLDVTVDGMPVQLVRDADMSVGGDISAYSIDPMPPEGATVEISGCPAEGCIAGPTVSLSLTVGPMDGQAPAAPELRDLSHRVEGHESFDCGELDDVVEPVRNWSWTMTPADDAADEVRVYVVDVGPVDAPQSENILARSQSEAMEVLVRRFAEDAGEEVCAVVRAYDPSGLASEPVQLCETLAEDDTLVASGCACSTQNSSGGAVSVGLMVLLLGAMRRRG